MNHLFNTQIIMKKLPFYGDFIVRKFKINDSTFVIGFAIPDGIDVRYPCYYLYRYNRKSHGCYEQLIGHPDVSYLYYYICQNFL